MSTFAELREITPVPGQAVWMMVNGKPAQRWFVGDASDSRGWRIAITGADAKKALAQQKLMAANPGARYRPLSGVYYESCRRCFATELDVYLVLADGAHSRLDDLSLELRNILENVKRCYLEASSG